MPELDARAPMMEAERWRSVKAAFEGALARPPEERRAFLEEELGGDRDLGAHVERLLWLDRPADGSLGAVIGPYRVLGLLGEGGVGTVYLAEEEAPLRRRVAVKLIRFGLESRGLLARFELERSALAAMDHPNIARILDAGSTRLARPYFAMDYIDGAPITDYCDARNLSVEARLELFVVVCRAVEHAHQRGIIHRDIKPSNILIREQDGKASPVIIDFGLAKAIETHPDQSLLTLQGQLVGTPQYMSPEQIELAPDELDSRTDVYSLGVLLYELLVGVPPVEIATDEGLPGFVKRITTEDVPAPSKRLRGSGHAERIASLRRTDASTLARTMRGDLERILAKALEKDRDERYPTAADLGGDVSRYLRSEPILARPPTSVYLIRRFLRRNRWSGYALGAILLAGLTASGATFLWFLRANDRREDRTAIVRVCDSVQLRVANAHLWFEEALAEDGSIDLERDVLLPIQASIDLVDGTLHGGETADFGPLKAVEHRDARAALERLRAELEGFEEITRERWLRRDEDGMIGRQLDQEYDAAYRQILASSVAVSTFLAELMAEDWRRSSRLGVAVSLAAIVMLGAPVVAGLGHLRARRLRSRAGGAGGGRGPGT